LPEGLDALDGLAELDGFPDVLVLADALAPEGVLALAEAPVSLPFMRTSWPTWSLSLEASPCS